MTRVQLVGIDPGIVHTGVVSLHWDFSIKTVTVHYKVVEGDTPQEHADEVVRTLELIDLKGVQRLITIEGYRDRGSIFSEHVEMRALLAELKRQLPGAQVQDNMGVKKVVKPKLLDLLGLRKFPTTHHQDLEAAARILVYGALKRDEHNERLAVVVKHHLEGQPWAVQRVGL